MADYDPQARRSRPLPAEQSPVDDLLGGVDPSKIDKVVSDRIPASEPMDGGFSPEQDLSGADEDQDLPFDTPPVQVTDERADLIHRFGLLAAVAGLIMVLALWRRRRRVD